MSLRAPLVVVVEVWAELDAGPRRWFRLSRNVGEDGVTLQRPLPLEVGRPVELRLVLPLAGRAEVVAAVGARGGLGAAGPVAGAAGGEEDDEATLSLRAEVAVDDGDEPHGDKGGRALLFLEPPRERRAVIARYVKERLALHLL
jgi:hypothetical protein